MRNIFTTLILDPRVVASLVASLLTCVDDLPRPFYGTFHDPGASLMLSIIFAQFTALAVLRRWDLLSTNLWIVAFLSKGLKGLFYVQNADILDSATLFTAHLLVAFLARKAVYSKREIAWFPACSFGFGFAFLACGMIDLFGSAFVGRYFGLFCSFVSARIIFPYFFWGVMMTFVSGEPKPSESAS